MDSPINRTQYKVTTTSLPKARRSYSRRSSGSRKASHSSFRVEKNADKTSKSTPVLISDFPTIKSSSNRNTQNIPANSTPKHFERKGQSEPTSTNVVKANIIDTKSDQPILTPSLEQGTKKTITQSPIYPIFTSDVLGIENELIQENSPSEINIETLVEEIITPSIHTPANQKVISDLDLTTRQASPEIEVVLLHNQMQRQIHYCLTISNNRERSVIAEMGGIDILVVDPSLSTLIEIKTSTDIIFNIRQAVGQLLEYEFFNREKIPGYKVQLMIVSPAELNDEAKEYLTHLRLVYDLDFKYVQYVPDSLIFTI